MSSICARSTRRAASLRERAIAGSLFVGHRQLDRLPPSCHDVTPRSIKHKRGEQFTGSMTARFMETVV